MVEVLALGETRAVTRKDGSTSEMAEAVVGETDGICRLVCWNSALLDGVSENATLRITGALEKVRQKGKEYLIDDRSTVEICDERIAVPFPSLGEVGEGGIYSVRGTVRSLQPARAFTSRDGRSSHVRNMVLTDEKSDLAVVLWGENALREILPGERLALYHASAKTGRKGDLELHAGGGSLVQILVSGEEEEITFSGTAIVTRSGTYIDNGTDRYLVLGFLPHGHEVRIRGMRSGSRITLQSWEEAPVDRGSVEARMKEQMCSFDMPDTFTPHGRQDI